MFDISAHLRARGWIVPAYTLAADATDVQVLRVVVREGLSRDMADLLLTDLFATVEALKETVSSAVSATASHLSRYSRHTQQRALGIRQASEPVRKTIQKAGTQGVY